LEIALTSRLSKEYRSFQESLYAERALRAGALGCLNKQESSEKVIEAISTILNGPCFNDMRNALRAGTVYFAIIFALGFLLGTVRTPLLSRLVGDVIAVAIELPVILTFSWIVCTWVLLRFEVPSVFNIRMVMGGSALAFLLAAEAILSVTLANRSWMEHFELYKTPPTLLGLFGQILFAWFPLIQSRSTPGNGNPVRK
jgi:hypothetical protein